jgi:hypothetical protein
LVVKYATQKASKRAAKKAFTSPAA